MYPFIIHKDNTDNVELCFTDPKLNKELSIGHIQMLGQEPSSPPPCIQQAHTLHHHTVQQWQFCPAGVLANVFAVIILWEEQFDHLLMNTMTCLLVVCTLTVACCKCLAERIIHLPWKAASQIFLKTYAYGLTQILMWCF